MIRLSYIESRTRYESSYRFVAADIITLSNTAFTTNIPANMPTLVGKEVGSTGYGLMGLTWRHTPPSQEQAFAAMKAALKNGMNFWNGGEFYGPPEYNSLVLLERYFAQYPEDADKVVLSIKGGVGATGAAPDGSPENTRRSIDTCIAQLKGRKKIDIFEFARRDQNVPMKTTFDVIEKECTS